MTYRNWAHRLPTATLGKAPKADRKRVVRWWKVAR